MKFNKCLFFLFGIILFGNSCSDFSNKSVKKINMPSSQTIEGTTTISHAKGFSIRYHDTYKVLSVLGPQHNEDTLFQYVLVQRDAPIPAGFKKAQIVQVPVRSIVCLSSIYAAYLDALGIEDKLIGIDEFKYVSSPDLLKRIKEGKLQEVGNSNSLNVERILALQPELVFTYGRGIPEEDSHPQLLNAGMKVAITVDHLETTPLGRAEWIKFMAAFFNEEAKADSFFNAVEQRYMALKELTKDVKTRPTAFSSVKFGDVWYMPGGDSYLAALLNDAGANYLWNNDSHTGSINLNFEQVFNKAKNADIWVNVNEWNSLKEALVNDSRNAGFKAYKTGMIFNNNARMNAAGGNDYWESGLLNPDILLADMIKIIQPQLNPKHQLYYYKKLGQ